MNTSSTPATLSRRLQAVCVAQAAFDSPLGPMLLARTANGVAGMWFDGQKAVSYTHLALPTIYSV